MIAQTSLQTIGCAVALDNINNAIAFVKDKRFPVFVDQREEATAIWGNDGKMNIGVKEYVYNNWYSLEDKPLYDYFKSLLTSDYIPMFEFRF